MLYRMLSKLLDYPDEGLAGVLWELRLRARQGTEFEAHERPAVETFVDYLESLPLTELQAAYVATFDMVPEHSLHLTHHLFGDDKNRGPALIDLTEFYKEYGLELAANELPDFLPLVLEFADQLDAEEAHMFLSQWTKVLKQLAANLEEARSPYAPLVRLVEDRAQLVKAAA
ncbi:MAG: nitrate reductase molybdenum cofactor assembly chaperone [Hydrogenophilales bacterium]|nr:nitrate reductase molybdenum cofactor assembly chaperone [Hydrogenophilales bacterium]